MKKTQTKKVLLTICSEKFIQLTFKTGLDFSATSFKSSMAPFMAVEALVALWGAKAAAEAARAAKRIVFMVLISATR